MALDIRKFGDPVLKTRAAPVESFDESLVRLSQDMLATMRDKEVGLAATQVGRLKRVFVAAIEDDEYVIVNPVLRIGSQTTETATEGCLSIPGIQVDVERPIAVTISGQDVSGKPGLRIEASDLLARVLQHEVDHLDGVLILDRTDRQSRKAAMREWREQLFAQQG